MLARRRSGRRHEQPDGHADGGAAVTVAAEIASAIEPNARLRSTSITQAAASLSAGSALELIAAPTTPHSHVIEAATMHARKTARDFSRRSVVARRVGEEHVDRAARFLARREAAADPRGQDDINAGRIIEKSSRWRKPVSVFHVAAGRRRVWPVVPSLPSRNWTSRIFE